MELSQAEDTSGGHTAVKTGASLAGQEWPHSNESWHPNMRFGCQTKPNQTKKLCNPQGSGHISEESSKQPANNSPSNMSDELSEPAGKVRVRSSNKPHKIQQNISSNSSGCDTVSVCFSLLSPLK